MCVSYKCTRQYQGVQNVRQPDLAGSGLSIHPPYGTKWALGSQTKVTNSNSIVFLWKAAFLACILCSAGAQEVSVSDPGLNAAIRQALQKPSGPLTESDLLSLTNLSAEGFNIENVEGLQAARNLRILDLVSNSLTNFPIADALTNLTILDLSGNRLRNFVLPNSLPHLKILDISFNSLTQLSLPAGMTNLDTLFLENNSLTNFDVPAGLTKLAQLGLSENQLTELHLPPDLPVLTALFVAGNPLIAFVLSEGEATNLSVTVGSLRDQGIVVFTYPSEVQLLRPGPLNGAFPFSVTGPPGVYAILGSAELGAWREIGSASNVLGSIFFEDAMARLVPQRFYRALQLVPASNMVFIPPNTFAMGSPTNELHRQPNEGPQTIVTLTHGFWIGKFEVTQGEYLSLMNTNPSFFPGDLSRPVSSVSWSDATNYCWKLTQRELAAGHIPGGSEYRLPTEAEWECAARAGTTTRFSYGDDLDYSNLTNYAWIILTSGFPSTLTLHPVGQKTPNPWGLFDMEGNVWEWTQDWLGDLPGGAVSDPSGPPSNSIGWKVVRGGAYDFDSTDCRSARRFFIPVAGTDTDIGFRVVLVIGSH
jgi:formylglycine-generating enzyme required for sulfatase activity